MHKKRTNNCDPSYDIFEDILFQNLSVDSYLQMNSIGITRYLYPFGIVTISVVWRRNRAKCDLNEETIADSLEERRDDLKALTNTLKEEKFDFKKLWSFLRPDSLYLLVAISVRIRLIDFDLKNIFKST